MRRLLPIRPSVIAAVAAALLWVAWISRSRLGAETGPLAALEEARLFRPLVPRLSIPTAYRPCEPLPSDGGPVPRAVCGAPGTAAGIRPAGESTDPDSVHATGLVDLIWSAGAEARIERAIEALRTAARLSERPARALADLAAAFLVRAEWTQNPRDLMEALDAAQRAVALEPENAAALFNRALALELLTIDGEAARAWDAYLAVDRDSPWAGEAARRKHALPEPLPPPQAPAPGASAEEVEVFASRYPQEARLLGWEKVLREWADAVLEGDTARAAALLRLAGGLGAALERRGGDASLTDAVRAIAARERDPRATQTLASAHRAYAVGQELFRETKFAAAADTFAHIVETPPPSDILIRWADSSRGGAVSSDNDREAGETLLLRALARVDSLRYPALAARTAWMLGTTRVNLGKYAEARDAFEAAARTFERLGEREHQGVTQALAGEAAHELADNLAGYALLHGGVAALRPYRASSRLHTALLQLAHAASMDGMTQAAAALNEEGIAVARAAGSHHVVEAHLTRARTLAEAGRIAEAARTLQSVRPMIDKLEATAHERFSIQFRYVEAVVRIRTDPRGAVTTLDSVVTFFSGDGLNVIWLLPALTSRIEAKLALSDFTAAEADLDSVTTLIRALSDKVDRAALRASMIEDARGAFDRLVMLHLAAGRTRDALRVLERGRTSFAPHASAGTGAPRLVAPRGEVAVGYALIGDTLLISTLSGDTAHVARTVPGRDALLRTIERARAALARPARAATAVPDLQRLHEWLVRPVQAHLGPAETPLVILADGEIAGVPFAALLDARNKRYLIEDHALRFAASLRDAALEAAPAPARGRPALLVADPAFDPAAYPALERLAGAAAEVEALAALYPGARVLRDAGATRAALLDGVVRAGVIHYAGHAFFDDERPGRSSLVLAGSGGAGRLTADSAATRDLRGVRLVVLSACETLRSRGGRSGGFAGFSGALLAAGAQGVVGSLWRVDDRLTAPLMVRLHREHLRSGDGADALRRAQLHLLRSGDPALRSPAAWAAFRYAGR